MPFREVARQRNYVTAGQLLGDYVGPISRKMYSFIILAVACMFCAAQLFVVGEIISATIGFPSYVIIPVIALAVGTYLWFGGYNSVIRTDYIQFFVVLALFCVVFFIPAPVEHLTDWKSFGSLGWKETFGLMIIPLIGYFGTPDFWQRIFSAKDEKTVKVGLPLGAAFFCLLTLSIIYIAFALRNVMPGAEPDQLFTLIFTEQAFSTPILTVLLLVIFAAGMSTLDTWAYVFSSTLMRDFVGTKDEDNRGKYILNTRISTIILLLIMSVLAISYQNIISVLMSLIGIYGIASPMFAAILWGGVKKANKPTDIAFALSTLAAFVVFVVMYVQGQFDKGFLITALPLVVAYAGVFIWLSIRNMRRARA